MNEKHDDFGPFRGRDIDFEAQKFDPFPNYRLKSIAMNMIRRIVKPSKIDCLVANLEYIGSRKMGEIEEMDLPDSTVSFLTNEFAREWLKPGAEALLTTMPEIMLSLQRTDLIEGESPFSMPFLTESIHGDNTKVALLVSPQCFEKNPDFPDKVMLN